MTASPLAFKEAARGLAAPEFNFRPQNERMFFSRPRPPSHALHAPRWQERAGVQARRSPVGGRCECPFHPAARRHAQGPRTARRRARALPVPSPVTCLAEAAQGRCSCQCRCHGV
ncbi:unnamed protein product [Rangifer tarandus platyrhynchus]|uniref:Uncharacterized protein n=1 Tax=Rangifer tarandus platyrhynchus TaxID=3082113 RepID=A0ABN8ZSA5_RANTA|nr:unnamed protein product [Rangifer tarandus platyrhynchus]